MQLHTLCKKSDCKQLDRWLHVPMLLLQVEALLAEKQQLLQRQEALQAEVQGLVAAQSALQGQLGRQRKSPSLVQRPWTGVWWQACW